MLFSSFFLLQFFSGLYGWRWLRPAVYCVILWSFSAVDVLRADYVEDDLHISNRYYYPVWLIGKYICRWTPPSEENDCIKYGKKKAIWKCEPKSKCVSKGYPPGGGSIAPCRTILLPNCNHQTAWSSWGLCVYHHTLHEIKSMKELIRGRLTSSSGPVKAVD